MGLESSSSTYSMDSLVSLNSPRALVGCVSSLFMCRPGKRVVSHGRGAASGTLSGVAGGWAVCGVGDSLVWLGTGLVRQRRPVLAKSVEVGGSKLSSKKIMFWTHPSLRSYTL